MEGGREGKSGGIVVVVPANDGLVWVVYKKGRIEKYTAYGKMLHRKVQGLLVCMNAPQISAKQLQPYSGSESAC